METEKISVGSLVRVREGRGKWSGAEGTVVSLEMIEDRGDTRELWATFKLDKPLNEYWAGSKVSFLLSEVELVKPKGFSKGDHVRVKEGRYDGWSGAEGTVFDYYGSGVGLRLTKAWKGQEAGSKVHFSVSSVERIAPEKTELEVKREETADYLKRIGKGLKRTAKEVRKGKRITGLQFTFSDLIDAQKMLGQIEELRKLEKGRK
jgi:hypothetical protein